MGMVKKLANRLLTHNRDKEGDFGYRVLLHIPIGLLMGMPLLGWALIPIFISYEQNEDLHTSDQAWKDYFGALVGCAITTIAFAIIVLEVIWKHGI